MSEPIKKIKQTPESYSPKNKPEILSIVDKLQEKEMILPSSKVLNFDQKIYFMHPNHFIANFAAAYIYIDKLPEKNINGLDEAFLTFCGIPLIRNNYENSMTEAKILCGDDGSYFASNHNVDFLFGYTGYEYDVITEKTAFKDSIIKSITGEKPVLAKVKSDGFCIITGYDEEKFISPNYSKQALNPETIETIYVFGNKIEPRYTLKDALKRILYYIEWNINEKIWDRHIEEINAIRGDKKETDELKKVVGIIANHSFEASYTWAFAETFNKRFSDELRNPKLDEMCSKLGDLGYNNCTYSWRTLFLKEQTNWDFKYVQYYGTLIDMVVELIRSHQKVDLEFIEIINSMIVIL